MMQQILLSKRDAAKALSISLRKIDYLIASKDLSVRRIGARILISRRSLEDFARRDHPTRNSKPCEVDILKFGHERKPNERKP